MKNSRYVVLDVGGTEIKGAACSDVGGKEPIVIKRFPSMATHPREELLTNLSNILKTLSDHFVPAGIGFAFPGPFDYLHGISKMRGINKYDSIYDVPLKPEIVKRYPEIANAPMIFLHDIEAFALGCIAVKEVSKKGKILCLCIGTGAGSAFIENGMVLKKADGIVPENGWLYNTPFHQSIIDDYISARGLARLSKEICGNEMDGLTLSKECNASNKKALQVYQQFGELLLEAIKPFMESFHPAEMVLGGQISKSFRWFGYPLQMYCKAENIKIIIESETSVRTMQGLLAELTRKEV